MANMLYHTFNSINKHMISYIPVLCFLIFNRKMLISVLGALFKDFVGTLVESSEKLDKEKTQCKN